MIATIKCPSHSPVEICAILGLSGGGDGLTVIDGCGYCNEYGQCYYRGKIKHTPGAARKEPEEPDHRRGHKEPGEAEDRKEHSMPEHREEHKERRKPGRGQVSLHAFLGGGGA